jgi:hypothetical protein
MGMARKAAAIELNTDERDFLERLVRRRKVARAEEQRAKIILRARPSGCGDLALPPSPDRPMAASPPGAAMLLHRNLL